MVCVSKTENRSFALYFSGQKKYQFIMSHVLSFLFIFIKRKLERLFIMRVKADIFFFPENHLTFT